MSILQFQNFTDGHNFNGHNGHNSLMDYSIIILKVHLMDFIDVYSLLTLQITDIINYLYSM